MSIPALYMDEHWLATFRWWKGFSHCETYTCFSVLLLKFINIFNSFFYWLVHIEDPLCDKDWVRDTENQESDGLHSPWAQSQVCLL